MSEVVVRVPGKINPFLTVRGRRPDGYHEIVTVLQTVSLHDRLLARLEDAAARLHPAARRPSALALTHDAGSWLPAGEDNLVVQAGRLLAGAVGATVRTGRGHRTDVRLEKRIPVAGGMAGGSADAAGTLLALNELWHCGLSLDELRGLGGQLGADVPFCMVGGTALATGTGADTARVLCRGSYDWVLGISRQPLATAEVYRAWDDVGEPSGAEPDAVLQALRTGDGEALGAALHNDLQGAAFHLRPRLRDARRAMVDAGVLGAVLSGSGPTMAALAADPGHARLLAGRIRDQFDRVEVVRSPAGGPQLERRLPGHSSPQGG